MLLKYAFNIFDPTIAGPAIGGALGGFGGELLGDELQHYDLPPQLANRIKGPMKVLGGVMGASVGKSLGNSYAQRPQMQTQQQPAMDPTTEDIPKWALRGANIIRPTMPMRRGY